MKPAAHLLPVLLCLASCGSQQEAVTPTLASLAGKWQYDSTGASFYSGRGRHAFKHKFMQPFSGAVLTIGTTAWDYTGTVRERHQYTHHGRTLLVSRLGRTDTLLITRLTPHRLVVQDSATDADGSLIRVWKGYYSR